MRYLLVVLFLFSFSLAEEYYAKLEPIESYSIKASVSGKVIFSNKNIEGKRAKNTKIIEIDSYVDRIDLEQSLKKLDAINEMIKLQNKNYQRLLKIKSKSGYEKDSQKINVVNLEVNKADTLINIANLRDSIKNKKLIEKNFYIYNIEVKEGDYVTPGTLLYEAKDLSQGKLEIYVPILEIEKVKNKAIFLNGKKTDLKIDKIYDVADSKHISSYKVKIIINKPKTFSRLIKIEFK
ncbi:efflux RND transporter periplasmic adaptor subunit [Halarcobacter anaerophilus]|uniref:HlyD family secretion protein n=1 Tax=Halarcobacter anaerophilus TaxID=877500 RepID=A0A4Q0Y2C8_9BACT|nr:HlyD family secretion protein [Halarcobacter anaerophilus]QDF29836.1 RND family efflux system, membrane fusion protein [Halarcobacter anaerophilus]RXJ62799.1 HlyD family secretion protein [Halarcobacter anaerophilus]